MEVFHSVGLSGCHQLMWPLALEILVRLTHLLLSVQCLFSFWFHISIDVHLWWTISFSSTWAGPEWFESHSRVCWHKYTWFSFHSHWTSVHRITQCLEPRGNYDCTYSILALSYLKWQNQVFVLRFLFLSVLEGDASHLFKLNWNLFQKWKFCLSWYFVKISDYLLYQLWITLSY